ncbi:hypothetical protein SG34_015695 [Thalassomonas viridans]|uniref:Uncharacterized protein n=1 Tax=Thalassomonas viridans TaxID=137584 RepID=A0AAE9YX91_9GAMM|nr:hypothetical protein [Thalassomonas viridans]WDE02886.1 hypothetical protein SG34_015695 [Thalassomonas viridans]
MKVKNAKSAFFLGLGLSFSLTINAQALTSSWEECLIDCLQRKQICLNAGVDPSLCERNMTSCRWGCGTPQ